MPSPNHFERLRDTIARHGFELPLEPAGPALIKELVDELSFQESDLAAWDPGPQSVVRIPWLVERIELVGLSQWRPIREEYFEPDYNGPGPWRPSWVVIARVRGGDPVFIDAGSESLRVYFAYHGAGAWQPVPLVPSVATFLESLNMFEQVLLDDFDLDVFDDHGIRSDFLAMLTARLTPIPGGVGFLTLLE